MPNEQHPNDDAAVGDAHDGPTYVGTCETAEYGVVAVYRSSGRPTVPAPRAVNARRVLHHINVAETGGWAGWLDSVCDAELAAAAAESRRSADDAWARADGRFCASGLYADEYDETIAYERAKAERLERAHTTLERARRARGDARLEGALAQLTQPRGLRSAPTRRGHVRGPQRRDTRRRPRRVARSSRTARGPDGSDPPPPPRGDLAAARPAGGAR